MTASQTLARLLGQAAATVDCADSDTVQRLYRATGKAAASKTEYLVGRWDVAQEIVQDVFLRLWQLKLRFPTDKQAYYWVYKSCHNAGIDHLRAAATRREQRPPEGFFGTLAAAADIADASAKRQLVLHLLSDLDDREAQVLCYAVIDGMTQEEIAELLGLSRKTVNRTALRLATRLAGLKRKENGHGY